MRNKRGRERRCSYFISFSLSLRRGRFLTHEDEAGCPFDAARSRATEVTPWFLSPVVTRHQSRPHHTNVRCRNNCGQRRFRIGNRHKAAIGGIMLLGRAIIETTLHFSLIRMRNARGWTNE